MSAWRSPHDSNVAVHAGKREALSGAVALSLLAFLLQLAGSWYTGSLALFGDSAHLLTDLFSLLMSLAAVVLASRPATVWRSFGFHRLEVLATFVNGLLLLVVSLGLAKESLERLWHPEPVKVLPLIVIATIGLLCNLLSAWVLHRASLGHSHHDHDHSGHDHHAHHEHEHHGQDHKQGHHDHHAHGGEDLHADRNMRSALLHVWSDALGSFAVIVGGVVMALTGSFWVDAAVGLVLSLWILRWSWRIIFDSAHVLLESTPRHVRPEQVTAELRQLDPRVVEVEDLHVWELTSRMYAATAEVRVREMDLTQADGLRLRMHEVLYERYGIAHVVLAIRPV